MAGLFDVWPALRQVRGRRGTLKGEFVDKEQVTKEIVKEIVKVIRKNSLHHAMVLDSIAYCKKLGAI
jgi:shikimate kinase